MNRRAFLTIGLAAGLSGCSELSGLDVGGTNSVGESVEFDGIDVTPTDAMTADAVEINTVGGWTEETAPENGSFGLFELEAHNTDFTDREIPTVNTSRYELMETDDDEYSLYGVNDVRVRGSDEGGHLPEMGLRDTRGFDGLRVNDATLESYPTDATNRARLDADERTSGWVFAIIPAGETPRLRVVFDGTTSTWSAEETTMTTPTAEPEKIPM